MNDQKTKNENKVSSVRLGHLEEDNQVAILRDAIQEGIDGGIANEFDPEKHLEILNSNKHQRENIEFD